MEPLPPRPTRARICLAFVTALTASLLLCQVLAVNAEEPPPPPAKEEPQAQAQPQKDDKPTTAAKPKRIKKVMPVKDFGDY